MKTPQLIGALPLLLPRPIPAVIGFPCNSDRLDFEKVKIESFVFFPILVNEFDIPPGRFRARLESNLSLPVVIEVAFAQYVSSPIFRTVRRNVQFIDRESGFVY